MRAFGLQLILSLLQFVWVLPALAARYDVYQRQLWNPNRVAAIVSQFQENDTVVFHPIIGPVRELHLGKFLDHGNLGMVFRLKDTQPPRVVKFPLGGRQTRTQWALKKQRQAYEAMDREQVPHPKLHGFNDSFYLEMDEVLGPNLGNLGRDWFTLTREERKDFLKELDHTVASLRASRVGFNDLYAENLMYDRASHQVLVADPGNAVPNGEKTLENIYAWIKSNEEIFNAWTERDHPQALEKVLTLQERRNDFITRPSDSTAQLLYLEMGGFTQDKLKGLPTGIKDEIARSLLLVSDEGLRSKIPLSDLAHKQDALKFILQDPQISFRTRKNIVSNLTGGCKTPSDFLGLLNLATYPYVDQNLPGGVSFDDTIEQFLKNQTDPQVIQDFYRSLPHPDLKRQMLFKLAVRATTTSEFFNVFKLPASPLSVREEVSQLVAMQLASNFLTRLDGPRFENLMTLRAKAQPNSLDPQVQKAYLEFYRTVSALALAKSTTQAEILQVFKDPQINKIPGLKRQMASLLFQKSKNMTKATQGKLILQLGLRNYTDVCLRESLSEFLSGFIKSSRPR